ncbi:mavicyanin-like [Herrania umbratica]|uniref:Mavicyanin-like n=1 Tax=Herrania umbratica TaxID=108875 RepID=A0A6J1AI28_9ROSI|nr:mavicyanin-like [Herrania umbratica]
MVFSKPSIISIIFIAFKAMEDKTVRYCSLFPIILMICFCFLKSTTSEVYNVGDEEGWNSEVDYVSWSRKYNFSVDDVLEFKYNKGQHDAFEVTEATYRSCNTSSGVLAKYETGDDQVKLTKSKKYWFVCNISGHCLGGMRFGIDVKAGNTSTNLGPTPSAKSGSTYAFERWSLSLFLFASGILLNVFC